MADDTAPAGGPKERGWVWYSSDESIAAGKISVLALAEIPCAMVLFWWIVKASPWPWWTWVGMLAAPMLLLRSEESIREGLRLAQTMVKEYRSDRWNGVSWLLVLTPALATPLYIAFQAGFSLRDSAFGVVTVVALAANCLVVIVLPFVAIRLIAAARHLRSGFSRLPHNWRETIAVVDPVHLPDLLPRIGTVLPAYALQTWLRPAPVLIKGHFFFRPVMVTTIVLPALLYRWNLKASALLWFPLALLLRTPFEGKDAPAKAESLTLTTKGFWATKREWLCYIVGTWLLIPLLPKTAAEALGALSKTSDVIPKVTALLAPPGPLSVRYWLLWLCVGLTFWLHKRATDYAALSSGAKEAVTPGRMAGVERLRLWATAAYVLTGWVFGLWFAQKQWPHLFGHMVWDWIRPWL